MPHTNMKLNIMEDDFDKYFARAAHERLDLDVKAQDKEEVEMRRGSLPIPKAQQGLRDSSPRRTASCKYPRSSSRRELSTSPQDISSARLPDSIEPITSSSSTGFCPKQLGLTNTYIHETTLRAPSPKMGIKSHSAPHSRSSSWKKTKRPRNPGEVHLDMESRPRTGSVPLEDAVTKLETLRLLHEEDLFVVRNFSTSSKGIINRGDSFKRRSNASMASETGSCEGGKRSRALSVNSSNNSCSHPLFRVLMTGDHGVGKTALMHQFMTSEYMGASDASFDDDAEITLSVLLDGDETVMDFMDAPYNEYKSHGDMDAYVVAYSICDRRTFQRAMEILYELRVDPEKHPAIILVGNKSDMVRSRQVSQEEAKAVCLQYDCKHIEVSAVLNHKVDELLVGIAKQIRLTPARQRRRNTTCDGLNDHANCVSSAKGLLNKILRRQSFVSKSCDNLLVL